MTHFQGRARSSILATKECSLQQLAIFSYRVYFILEDVQSLIIRTEFIQCGDLRADRVHLRAYLLLIYLDFLDVKE